MFYMHLCRRDLNIFSEFLLMVFIFLTSGGFAALASRAQALVIRP